MKFRFIRITFKQDLTENQEAILTDTLELLRDGWQEKLERVKKQITRGISGKILGFMPIGRESQAMMVSYLSKLLLDFSLYVKFSKKIDQPELTVFQLDYAYDELCLAKFNLGKYDFKLAHIYGTDDIIRGIKTEILPLRTRTGFHGMGVKPENVIIETGEFDDLDPTKELNVKPVITISSKY
jgi:hypothetical protein